MKNKSLKILSALGLASLPACEVLNNPNNNNQLCMYGCPSAEYKVIGKVTDESGNPIEGIKVKNIYEVNGESNNYTDKEGEFSHSSIDMAPLPIVFEDVDGDLNGGSFETDTLKTLKAEDFAKIKNGEGAWDMGTYEIKEPVIIKLKKK